MNTLSKRIAVLAVLALSTAILQAQSPKKLLVVTVTKGFRHSSIPTAEKVIGELAKESNAFTVDYVRNDEEMAVKMAPAALAGYDGFVFANTTGVLPIPDKAAFLNAVTVQGKAFIGMHSASDTYHGPNDTVDPYIAMLGGEFLGHGAQVGVECLVMDRQHPATKHLGESYCIQQEEIYLLKNYDRNKVRDLLILDKHPNKKSEKGHFPVSWCKKVGAGNVFYTTLGHREDVWENPLYRGHILGGIKWALGLEKGEVAPIVYAD
ncbi:MAG: ThuA domain-containing protein [Limisphaerales bacterium]|jgi:type 1 glutamine amidotransferase